MANRNSLAARRLAAAAGKSALLQFWFTYSLNIGSVSVAGAFSNSVANNAQGTIGTQIQADSSFLLQYLTGALIATDGSGVVANPVAFLQLTDTSSGANLFDQQQLFGNVVGTAQLPLIAPIARLLPANSQIQATLQNNSGKAVIQSLALLGQKLYEQG